MLTEIEEIVGSCDQILFLSLDKVRLFTARDVLPVLLTEIYESVFYQFVFQNTCLRRRLTRSYEPPDVDGYFDEIAWPAYIQHQKKAFEMARTDPRFSFLDVSSGSDEATEENLMQVDLNQGSFNGF